MKDDASRGVAWDFEGVQIMFAGVGRKVVAPKAAQPNGIWGHPSSENY